MTAPMTLQTMIMVLEWGSEGRGVTIRSVVAVLGGLHAVVVLGGLHAVVVLVVVLVVGGAAVDVVDVLDVLGISKLEHIGIDYDAKVSLWSQSEPFTCIPE